MNEYRGKHSPSVPWGVSSTASSDRYRPKHSTQNRRRKRIWIILIILAGILMVYPFVEATFMLRVNQISMTSSDLPADIRRLRIVFLSDVHYGFFFSDSRVNSLISRINSLKPDVVLFGGDIGDTPDDAIAFYKHLSSLHARYAMLGVLGESDHGETDLERTMVTDAMRDAGVTPLVNDLVSVRIGTSMIHILGLDDVRTGTPTLSALSAQTSTDDFVVLLCHNPSIIPETQRSADRNGRLGWFDLALYGHTHGGQIAFLSDLLDIAGDVDDRYQHGWFVENRSNILVSNGVGTSVLPCRFLRPPQIHCVDIAFYPDG